MKDMHFTSRMLTCAGGLVVISAILMGICVGIAYGGILLAAASCMFFGAYHFRIAEDAAAKKGGEKAEDAAAKKGEETSGKL